MSETTDTQIDEMKALAERLERDPMVDTAWIDDWGRNGNFTLMITPTVWDRTATNRLRGLVKRYLKTTDAHFREVFPPELIGKSWDGKRQYHANFWKFSIDYQTYHLATNSFG